ncbi:MAG: AbrB family transcriptional regulator [Bacillota bacterium]
MILQTLGEFILIYGLGICAWQLFARLPLAAPEIIGPLVLIGALRISQIGLPPAPDFLFPAAQVIIGIFIGSMLNKSALHELRQMVLPALVIIVWTLSMIFIIGLFLHRFSVMDLPTAMLSASMGGLPEITVLAIASGAIAAVVILMQMIRMVGTVMLFPVMVQWLERKKIAEQIKGKKGNCTPAEVSQPDSTNKKLNIDHPENIEDNGQNNPGKSAKNGSISKFKTSTSVEFDHVIKQWHLFKITWKKTILTLSVAIAGGLLLHYLGVPAGLMVGSSFLIATASIAGLPISKISPRILSLLLVAIGVNLSENITIETLYAIANPDLLFPILVASIIMFASSFGVAWIIANLTNWDYPTSFLAAAPAGFTVMTALALKYELNPVRVSMLHLCRLFSIKIFLPFYFMTLI